MNHNTLSCHCDQMLKLMAGNFSQCDHHSKNMILNNYWYGERGEAFLFKYPETAFTTKCSTDLFYWFRPRIKMSSWFLYLSSSVLSWTMSVKDDRKATWGWDIIFPQVELPNSLWCAGSTDSSSWSLEEEQEVWNIAKRELKFSSKILSVSQINLINVSDTDLSYSKI